MNRIKSWVLSVVYILLTASGWAQMCTHIKTFTWEGAPFGNKAIWRADDMSNTYTVDDIEVKVSIIDPYQQNTTTSNPSEYGDYTATNTFYGRGALAFQITANQSNQPVCIDFEFSVPIVLNKLNLWDIDYIASSSRKGSTYQDSLSMRAYMGQDSVPVRILPQIKGDVPYTIEGQSLYAHYIPGKNGDLNHKDSLGSVQISTDEMITNLQICYANGSADDGLSNSQALKITSFDFCIPEGSISGFVLEDQTDMPLSGVAVSLTDENGMPLLDSNGLPYTTLTDSDGAYHYTSLPLRPYYIRVGHIAGYDLIRDFDMAVLGTIVVDLRSGQREVTDQNFYAKAQSPLPVVLRYFEVVRQDENSAKVTWKADVELNHAYYSVWLSTDGIRYILYNRLAQSAMEEATILVDHDMLRSTYCYIKLVQVDMDGTEKILGIKVLHHKEESLPAVDIYPTIGVGNTLFIHHRGHIDVKDIDVLISDLQGRVLNRSTLTQYDSTIDVSFLNSGMYIITFHYPIGKYSSYKFIKE